MRSKGKGQTARLVSLAVAAACLAGSALAAYPLTTDSNCHCYKTNATSSNYFAHHKFFDFRQLAAYARVPPLLQDANATANAPPPSPYFLAPEFAGSWAVQSWNNSEALRANKSDPLASDATVLMVNSPNNIYIERNTDPTPSSQTHLTMRTARLQDFQTAAELESVSQGYQFLSVRMYARTRGAKGAVTAMFTYRAGPNNTLALVQEADLEIRTADPPTAVQYTNQPSWNATGDIPQATRNATLPDGRHWSDWAYYRLDWTPGSSTWYVNGKLASEITFQAPRDPAQVVFNTWSDGGSWSGNMSSNEQAYLQIQWIEMVYNSTDPFQVKTGSCLNVCSIDETTRIGTPVLMTNTGQIPPQPPAPGFPGSGQGGQGGQGGQTGGGAGACQSAKWGQCAGKNWNGCRSCVAGTTCQFQNDYYSQCL
ncbi:hypothetical protein VTK73DRAFT_7917 [Phialemonium thermophilum]|uniref:Uncharacterized protein n=1 Tax=Phialemonium thermophilum TaxID=223376 RepID=A0ABR3WBW6_9PEZI